MGAACGSARDSITPSRDNDDNPVNQQKRNRKRKLTSLDDIINVKQRKSAEIKLSQR